MDNTVAGQLQVGWRPCDTPYSTMLTTWATQRHTRSSCKHGKLKSSATRANARARAGLANKRSLQARLCTQYGVHTCRD